MKKLFFISFILITAWLSAQSFQEKKWQANAQKELQQDYQTYTDAIYNKNWEQVADMLYPGIYQLDSRENLLRALQNGTESPEYKIEINPSTDVYYFPQYIEKNKKKYALIAYTNNFTMIFHPKPQENEMTFKGRMDYTYHQLKKHYGNQVIQGSKPGIFHFHIPKYILAVYLPEKSGFTFLDFSTDPKTQTMLEQILDKDIIQYYANKVKSKN